MVLVPVPEGITPVPVKIPGTGEAYCARFEKLVLPQILAFGIEKVGLGKAVKEISSKKQ